MSRINHPRHHRRAGFTLVEVVVIAPILILTLGGFIVALVTMVGDTLANRDSNALVYDTQTALDRIEQDVRLSTTFLQTTGTLPSPQGSDANYTGTAAFTASSSNNLLLATLSTTTNPLDPTRQVVYFANQPNPCGTLQSYNTPLTTTVIYFVYNGALYRRTAIPSYTLTAGQATTVCATPWQQNSCSPGYSSAQCNTQDAKLMDNVSSLALAYYGSSSSTTDLGPANAAAATTVGVTITTQKVTAGQTLTNSSTSRITRLNVAQ